MDQLTLADVLPTAPRPGPAAGRRRPAAPARPGPGVAAPATLPGQTSIAHALAGPITVEPTAEVLDRGCCAESVPRHAAPAHPTIAPAVLAAMLASADHTIRCAARGGDQDQALASPQRTDYTYEDYAPGGIETDRRGIAHRPTGARIRWPEAKRMIVAQRAAEPHVAQARDLAEAYYRLASERAAHAAAPDCIAAEEVAAAAARLEALGGDPGRAHMPR